MICHLRYGKLATSESARLRHSDAFADAEQLARPLKRRVASVSISDGLVLCPKSLPSSFPKPNPRGSQL